jgi:CRISPR-associated endoribonuclease Cas6
MGKMLIALSLLLESPVDAQLPFGVGRANHAATLAYLHTVDPNLADAIHNADGPKPLTCSDLIGAKAGREGLALRAGQPLRVRITGLTSPVAQALTALLERPPATWTLVDHEFQVTGAVCDSDRDPWTGRSSYETLAATRLLGQPSPAPLVTLRFSAPTGFKSKGVHMPVPLPELLFGSLVDRWNAFSPVTVSPDMRRFAAEMIAISRYELHSRAVSQKGGGVRMGGVGLVSYRALGGDRYWWRVMQMLADFAQYGGAGVQTATGMGQVRRVA